MGIVTDGEGNIYVADKQHNKIRKVSPEGIVTTLKCELNGVQYYPLQPIHLTIDWSGLYVTLDKSNSIVKICIPQLWKPSNHRLLPRTVQRQIKAIMILSRRRNSVLCLPKDILYYLFHLVCMDCYNARKIQI